MQEGSAPGAGWLVDGRYRAELRLGAGSSGTVWSAVDRTGRWYAVKQVPPPARHGNQMYVPPDRWLKQVRREVAALQRLRGHANIVDVVEYVAPEIPAAFVEASDPREVIYRKSAWIVMEYIEARTLREVIRRQGRLAPRDVIRIARDLLRAIGALHAAGLVHRDVKPDNVMLTGEAAILVDFGIALADDETRFTMDGTRGTLRFMAPELIRGMPAEHASDIYAIGITLYEALEGRTAFPTDEKKDLPGVIRRGEILPFSRSGPLEQLIADMISLEPDQRVGVEEALDWLHHIEESEQRLDDREAPRSSLPTPVRRAAYTAPFPIDGRDGAAAVPAATPHTGRSRPAARDESALRKQPIRRPRAALWALVMVVPLVVVATLDVFVQFSLILTVLAVAWSTAAYVVWINVTRRRRR